MLGDTGRGKESFAREIRLSGCVLCEWKAYPLRKRRDMSYESVPAVSKTTAGTLSYDISRRFRSG